MSRQPKRRLNEHGIREGLANLRDTEARLERQQSEIQRKIGLLEVDHVTVSKSLAAVQFAIQTMADQLAEAEAEEQANE